MKELQKKVLAFAKEKGINNEERQLLKFYEELGEMAKELLRPKIDLEALKLEIGDVAITIIIYYDLIKECLDLGPYYSPFDINFAISKIAEDVFYLSFYPLRELHLLCHKHNTTLEECLELAYNKISKRTGQTINGQFIKDAE